MPAPGSKRGCPPSILFSAFMLMNNDGAKRFEDIRRVHRQPGLMNLFGFEKVPETRTLGNWLRRISDSRHLMQVLVEINKCMLSAHLHHCKRVTQDIDAKVIEFSKRDAELNYKGSRKLFADSRSPR